MKSRFKHITKIKHWMCGSKSDDEDDEESFDVDNHVEMQHKAYEENKKEMEGSDEDEEEMGDELVGEQYHEKQF